MSIEILQGDCRSVLDTLSEEKFNTCITSPPYWGLRDYQTGQWVGGDPDCPHMRTTKIGKTTKTITGHKAMHDQNNVVGDAIYKSVCPKCGATREDLQLGLEETPEEYVENLVAIFRKVKRVLRKDGTVWLNLGDSYSGSGKGSSKSLNKEHHNMEDSHSKIVPQGLKQKDLVGIPWRVAFALQADGWYLRQDIIWHKPNPMPESVKDRCTKAHEYIFLLSKSRQYYYDHEAIKEDVAQSCETKNKRSVWTVSPKPFKEAHFAVYPTELIEPCVLAGCPENGNVLDPFGGSGTTGLVSDRLRRNATLIELNSDYAKICENRIHDDAPLFLNM